VGIEVTANDSVVQAKPVLVLPAILDATVAAELKQELQLALGRGDGVDIDAGAVNRVTCPCLQVLAAAFRQFAQAGGPALTYTSISPAFSDTACGLALSEALGIPETP